MNSCINHTSRRKERLTSFLGNQQSSRPLLMLLHQLQDYGPIFFELGKLHLSSHTKAVRLNQRCIQSFSMAYFDEEHKMDLMKY